MAYQQAIDQNPASAEAAFKFASYMERERRHLESAQELYVQALSADPQHVPSLLGLARCRALTAEHPAGVAAPFAIGSSVDGNVGRRGGGQAVAAALPSGADAGCNAGGWFWTLPADELFGRVLGMEPTNVEASVGRAQALFHNHRANPGNGAVSLRQLEEARALIGRAVAAGE